MNKDRHTQLEQSDDHSSACDRVRERLAELWDGRLAPVDTARDQGHLEACAECRSEWEQLNELLGAVAEISAPEAELDFASVGLAAKLDVVSLGDRSSSWKRFGISTLLPLAACALALIAIRALSDDQDAIPTPLSNSLHELGSWGSSIADWGEAVNDFLPTIDIAEVRQG